MYLNILRRYALKGKHKDSRGGSRTAVMSEMELFVIMVKPLTIITKCSILDVAAVLHPPLVRSHSEHSMFLSLKLILVSTFVSHNSVLSKKRIFFIRYKFP